MPIRFRCVYCDKLLGIARRKAGAVVNCPQCGQPLIVPTPEPGAEPEPDPMPAPPRPAAAPVPPTPPGRLFERDDFDVLLEPDARVRNPDPPSPTRRPAPAEPANGLPPSPFAAERRLPTVAEPAARPRGLVLSTPMVTLGVLAVLFLMGVAFGGGVLAARLLNLGAG